MPLSSPLLFFPSPFFYFTWMEFFGGGGLVPPRSMLNRTLHLSEHFLSPPPPVFYLLSCVWFLSLPPRDPWLSCHFLWRCCCFSVFCRSAPTSVTSWRRSCGATPCRTRGGGNLRSTRRITSGWWRRVPRTPSTTGSRIWRGPNPSHTWPRR